MYNNNDIGTRAQGIAGKLFRRPEIKKGDNL